MNVTPELLKRYHLGECSEKENEAVSIWLEEDNIAIADEAPEISPVEIAQSRSAVWDMLKERILEEDTPAPMQSRRTTWRWLPYVAAATLLITLSTMGLVKYNAMVPVLQEEPLLHTHVSYGEKKILTLHDGTKVYLNAGATLSYPKSFSGDTRSVKLTGEAYFEVTANKEMPFIIHTAYDTQIKVVGTAFNVRSEPHMRSVEVAVSEGTVHFMTTSNQNGFVKLNAGQFAIYDSTTHSFAEGFASAPFIGHWRENKLVFDQEPLHEVFRKIEKWYGYKIIIAQEQMRYKRYSGRYEGPKLEELLESMAFVLNFKYKIDDENKIVNIY